MEAIEVRDSPPSLPPSLPRDRPIADDDDDDDDDDGAGAPFIALVIASRVALPPRRTNPYGPIGLYGLPFVSCGRLIGSRRTGGYSAKV